MSRSDDELREQLSDFCRRLYERDMVSSTGGNVSARSASGAILISPTGRSLANLEPREFVAVDAAGAWSGGTPSKELPLHAAVYANRPDVGAVIHGHSAVAIAVAGLLEPSEDDAFPAYTAGYVMRVGRLPMLGYYPSGSQELADGVERTVGSGGRAVLLQNHGFVTAGPTLEVAHNTAEELIDALKVFVFSSGRAPALPRFAREALAARRTPALAESGERAQRPPLTEESS
ncbi:MAG: aldolase [Conexibacter sp.]|jgi:ribulose-5-phosphate 4-epimerase/fuculose-1-phosphate aldolase|nr:aldolase [Conexibacter sp.]